MSVNKSDYKMTERKKVTTPTYIDILQNIVSFDLFKENIVFFFSKDPDSFESLLVSLSFEQRRKHIIWVLLYDLLFVRTYFQDVPEPLDIVTAFVARQIELAWIVTQRRLGDKEDMEAVSPGEDILYKTASPEDIKNIFLFNILRDTRTVLLPLIKRKTQTPTGSIKLNNDHCCFLAWHDNLCCPQVFCIDYGCPTHLFI